MRTLSVRQPWAWAIIHGGKRIENRSRRLYHRGPLLIHAGKALCEFEGRADFGRLMPGLPPVERLAFGAIIGVVDVVDCVPYSEVRGERFAEGPWCWIFARPRPLGPVPWRGQQGIFDVPDEALRRAPVRS